jgi:micrococcal nuclease
MPAFRWLWRAQIVRVVDGDTFDLLIDRGFRATQVERVRLLDANTPEVVGTSRAAGLAARAFTETWTAPSSSAPWPLLIETYQPKERDAVGRWLVDVWRDGDGHNLDSTSGWRGTWRRHDDAIRCLSEAGR